MGDRPHRRTLLENLIAISPFQIKYPPASLRNPVDSLLSVYCTRRASAFRQRALNAAGPPGHIALFGGYVGYYTPCLRPMAIFFSLFPDAGAQNIGSGSHCKAVESRWSSSIAAIFPVCGAEKRQRAGSFRGRQARGAAFETDICGSGRSKVSG